MKERHKILLLSSAVLFSFYFAYDIPSALSHHVGFEPEDEVEYKITLLYSVYSLPNIAVPLFFGWITHINKSTLAKLLCAFVFIGHLVFTAGVWYHSFRTMLAGRFLFGIGGESFAVIQNKLISYEFKGKELGFAMGLFSSIARLGTVANFLLTPLLADTLGRMFPCIMGVGLTFLGLWICFKINHSGRSHKILKQRLLEIQKAGNNASKEQEECIKPMFDDAAGSILSSPRYYEYAPHGSIQGVDGAYATPFFHDYGDANYNSSSIINSTSNPILSENPFLPWAKNTSEETTIKSRIEKSNPKILFEESGTLFYEPKVEGKNTCHSAFYVLVAISFMFALVWAPFYSVAPMLFQKRYGLSTISSGNILAIIEGISLVLITFTSTITDIYGMKLWLIAAGCILFIMGHSGIYFAVMSPHLSAVMLGLSSPLIACYWPCIPSLVSEESLGTGFATIYCILNLAFTFSPIAVAFLATGDSSYDSVEAYILAIGACSLVLTGILSYLNLKQSLGLNAKPVSRADDDM
ncbi:major facilitator superfamily protein [Ordospora pajunii]|uniref:major facilitator superfamily protein n=1 Tax=Ordospora pajunii TaxID=3039483 RepID=UPI0029528E10|nr:major facilitator superfamily protein [Ordospora pajunii]KAH9411462.1 major facilitator superfamily protein [Ordospora pajunii]